MTGRLSLVTAPEAEPLRVVEAKLHLKVDDTTDDALIAAWIAHARMECEGYTERAFMAQTWDWKLDAFPCDSWGVFRVPLPPLVSVTSVKYIDGNGTEQTVSTGDYTVHTHAGPHGGRGLIALNYGKSWPTPRAELGAVRVRFVAGYTGQIPEPLLSAMKLIIGDLHEHRQTEIAALTLQHLPTVERLLLPFKMSAY